MPACAHCRLEKMSELGPIDCRSAMMQLYDYLDGELSPERMALIRAHLDDCRPCYAHAQFERDLLAIISGGWKDVAASKSLRERIQANLRNAGFSRDAGLKGFCIALAVELAFRWIWLAGATSLPI